MDKLNELAECLDRAGYHMYLVLRAKHTISEMRELVGNDQTMHYEDMRLLEVKNVER